MEIKEVWLTKHCLYLPRDKALSVTVAPDIPYTITNLFIVFDQPYTGELEVTSTYSDELSETTDVAELTALTKLRELGVASISGLQDINVSFENRYIEGQSVQPLTDMSNYSPFRRITRTPFAQLVQVSISDSSVPTTGESISLVLNSVLPNDTPLGLYPVIRVDDTAVLVTDETITQAIGLIRYATSGSIVDVYLSGEIVIPVTTAPLGDYFVTGVSPYLTDSISSTINGVVRMGSLTGATTFTIDLEVLLYGR